MQDLLRSIWHEPRSPDAPRRVWRDWALVAVLVPAAFVELIFRPDVPWRPFTFVATLIVVPTLLWRRTHPLWMVVIAFSVMTVLNIGDIFVTGEPLGFYTMAGVLLLPYALFRWGSGKEALAGFAFMAIPVGVSLFIDTNDLADVIGGSAIFLCSIALGEAFRYRARARSRELRQVKMVEREHLARDLHDTVAHHVSAIAIRAQAGLATAAARPEAAVEALTVIEAEASRTLAEMRDMVRVLRRDDPDQTLDLAPNPTVADLRTLAGRSQGGPQVDVDLDGPLDDLPPQVGTALFRLAQESVTNALRHARHATRIAVRVEADGDSVRLQVTDDGESPPSSIVTPGYGLIGMTERAHLLGGSCRAGPNHDRGWTVDAVLPRAGAGR